MDQQQHEQRDARKVQLEKLAPQDLLNLARKYGINLLNGPFIIENILDQDFPKAKEPQLAQ